MIAIDNVLLTDQIIEEHFVCDLTACKGACCVDGDAGAPLQKSELKEVNAALQHVKPLMRKEGLEAIETQGNYVYNEEFGWVTPTVNNAICAYGIYDEQGVVKCAFEQAYNDGKIKWKKPISCHLFPIIVKQSTDKETLYANYSPRKHNCKAACSLGKKLKVPVFEFLKEPLIRRFGKSFYEALQATAQHLSKLKL
jgi:hypothetical protein